MGYIQELKDYRILSISSATGWSALFAIDNCQGYIFTPLACWALVENSNGPQKLVGICPMVDEMAGEMQIADFEDSFMGFKHETESIPEDEIRARLKVIKDICVRKEK